MLISELGGEDALINLIKTNFGAGDVSGLALGIGDDCALIESGDSLIAVTTDLLVEGTHFRMDINEPYALGWKSAAVNISDIAAMGGVPTYTFVSIGLPDIEVSIVEEIYRGMRDACKKYGSVIAGGDTVGSGAGIVINITQLGRVNKGREIRRSTAKQGDAIIVTNNIGESRAGLEMLLKLGMDESRRICDTCVERHIRPEPRVAEAQAAANTGRVNAGMDLSDGLAADLPRLCAASNVGARIFADKIPISNKLHEAALALNTSPIALAIGGGEDYELLLTTPSPNEVIAAIESAGSTASSIGEIIEGSGAVLVSQDGREEPLCGSWKHF